MKIDIFVRKLAGTSTAIAFSFGISSVAQATQLVFLDFDSQTEPEEYIYSATERNIILDNIAADYSLFDFEFTLDQPHQGDFSTLFFNAGVGEGLAQQVDFRNLDKNDTATININPALGAPGVDLITLSSNIAAHELGHLVGLRHVDSFGPIGSGIFDPPAASIICQGLPNSPSVDQLLECYDPNYPGPANANETPYHLMAFPLEDAFLSERSAVRLSFNEQGKVVSEESGNNSLATAQNLTLASLDVPNPLLFGENAGKKFLVDALAVTGSLSNEGETDFFSFEGSAGDLFYFEVNSQVLSRIPDQIDSQLSIFDSSGNLVPYYNGVAFNDNEFESFDSSIVDLRLPKDDTYFIKVNASSSEDIGDYELYGYQFEAVGEVEPIPEPSMVVSFSAGALFLFATSKFRRWRRSK
ncbi:MAG: hypothetical protein AB1589_10265 [Cyanobacteriota bacterium]